MDRLLVEEIGPRNSMRRRVIGLLGDLADNEAQPGAVHDGAGPLVARTAGRGEFDPADRRNRLFRHAAGAGAPNRQ